MPAYIQNRHGVVARKHALRIERVRIREDQRLGFFCNCKLLFSALRTFVDYRRTQSSQLCSKRVAELAAHRQKVWLAQQVFPRQLGFVDLFEFLRTEPLQTIQDVKSAKLFLAYG